MKFAALTALLLLQAVFKANGASPTAPPKKTAIALPHRGIANVGATCYFNTATQSINALPKLVHIILQADASKVLEADAREALLGLQTLLYSLNFGSEASLPSSYIRWFVAKVTSLFKCGWVPFAQNASDEYFGHFISLLKETLLSKEPKLAAELTELLQIQLVSSINGVSSGKTEPAYALPVSLLNSTTLTLEQALERFTAVQSITGYGPKKEAATRQLQIACAPPILALYLNRFKSPEASKNKKRVSFPETLDLAPYMRDSVPASAACSSKPGSGKVEYFLVGTSEHIGTTIYSAHYTFHRRPDPKGKPTEWYSFNDSSVESTGRTAAMDSLFLGSNTATMLFYVRSDQLDAVLNPDFEPSDAALNGIKGELLNVSTRHYTEPYSHYSYSSGSSGYYTPSKTHTSSKPPSDSAPSQTPAAAPSEGASSGPPSAPCSSDQSDTQLEGKAQRSIFSLGTLQGFWNVLGKPLVVAGCILGFVALVVIVPAAL